MEKYKMRAMIISSLGIMLLVVGVSYSFFNYTRTGAINNLGTGRIYFNSEQNGTLNMTNIFPLTSTQAGEAQLDTVTVGIVGDTTYADGEEYEISLVDVNNTINGKKIPINYIATYAPNSGKVIGTPSNDYFNAREDKDANIYLLNATGKVEEGKQVLVGYIKNSATGISGTLTIKAYIDASGIAISDTYPENEPGYKVNSDMTQSELDDCVDFVVSNGKTVISNSDAENFCRGTITLYGMTFQESIDNDEYDAEGLAYLESHNIILNQNYLNGTTSNWVDGRTVLTTSEWNALGSTPISFKIRAESNEGIWVEEPSKGIESCPDCKFMYYVVDPNDIAAVKWTTWNNQNQTPTQITSGLYDNYEELIATTGKNYFLGVKLNNNNEVTNAYACGVKDNEPFCLEGTSDGSKYTANQTLLQGANLYNNSCTVESNYTECGPWDNSGSVSASAHSDGDVDAGVGDDYRCTVGPPGYFGCLGSEAGVLVPGGGEPPKW